MNLKYLFGALLIAPCLPILYFQGEKLKREIPKLPEAEGPSGLVKGKSNKIIRLLTIGESTIAGVGVETHEEGFTGTLAKTLAAQTGYSVSWRVYARSGYTAKRSTYKLIPKVEEKEADLIVVGSGGNDAFNLNTISGWRKDVSGLIDAIETKFPSTPIVFNNMPPIKSFPAFTGLLKFSIGNLVELFGKELSTIVEQKPNVYYNAEVLSLKDWIARLDLTPDAFFSDGVHPSKLTYQVWAREMGEFILRLPVELF